MRAALAILAAAALALVAWRARQAAELTRAAGESYAAAVSALGAPPWEPPPPPPTYTEELLEVVAELLYRAGVRVRR